jgi:hypothetical protein
VSGARHPALILLAACGTRARPAPLDAGAPRDALIVHTIEVTHERDWPSHRLEIEVHVFDAISFEHLGCVALTGVDFDDVRYTPDLAVRTPDGTPLPAATLAGRKLRVEVVEDDADSCPTAPGTRDDTLGLIGPATLDQLTAAPARTHHVIELGLVVAPASVL